MSKAILVVDMPQSCSKCKFAYQFNGIHKCHLMNVSNGRYTRISETTFAVERHYHCPLKEVPEKKKGKNSIFQIYANGWNACIDTILEISDDE